MKAFIQRHPALIYCAIVLLISWGGFLALAGPKLLRGEAMQPPVVEYGLFPVMVLSVCLTGIILIGTVDGRDGLRDLLARIGYWRVGLRWYAVALLTSPALVLAVLLLFRTLVSPVFAPKIFLPGILFGLPGFLEEVGWTGYAFPKIQVKYRALPASLLLGVLWGLWHLPVVDYLGAAAPHGAYWGPFALTFIAIATAMRVLIAWVYSNTRSVLLTQLMHVSFTATLVVLDPVAMSPAQETLWYAVYAAVLWIAVAIVAARKGPDLLHKPVQRDAANWKGKFDDELPPLLGNRESGEYTLPEGEAGSWQKCKRRVPRSLSARPYDWPSPAASRLPKLPVSWAVATAPSINDARSWQNTARKPFPAVDTRRLWKRKTAASNESWRGRAKSVID